MTSRLTKIVWHIRKYKWTPQIGFFVLLLVSMYLINTLPSSQALTKHDAMSLTLGDTIFSVDVADTESARIQGLSGRRHLPEDEVLLFVFELPGEHSIWMKDMHFSIDILWLEKIRDEKGIIQARIVDMATRISPSTYPFIFKPLKSAHYVLEAHEGFVSKHGLKIGSVLEFEDNIQEK